jgi:hypothetical protein
MESPSESTLRDKNLKWQALPADVDFSKWYPPRLLDISSDSPHLVLANDVRKGAAFAALSHCWGKAPFLGLTSEDISRYEQDGIDPSTLPQNFKDVVKICRWLQIPYIWIDSLCLIQSGPGSKTDWENHADLMRKIYVNTDLCISTAAADGATKSCFSERNVATITPAAIKLGGQQHLVLDNFHELRGFHNAPIASRAWVLQERLLSRRILTFEPKQIFWECSEPGHGVLSETFPQGICTSIRISKPFSLPDVEISS